VDPERLDRKEPCARSAITRSPTGERRGRAAAASAWSPAWRCDRGRRAADDCLAAKGL